MNENAASCALKTQNVSGSTRWPIDSTRAIEGTQAPDAGNPSRYVQCNPHGAGVPLHNILVDHSTNFKQEPR